MNSKLVILCTLLPLIGFAENPLDVGHQSAITGTNVTIYHYNSWGVKTTNWVSKEDNKIIYLWRDDSQRARFNNFQTNNWMDTNGVIHHK